MRGLVFVFELVDQSLHLSQELGRLVGLGRLFGVALSQLRDDLTPQPEAGARELLNEGLSLDLLLLPTERLIALLERGRGGAGASFLVRNV